MSGTVTRERSAIHKFAVPISDEPTLLNVPLSAGVLAVEQQGPIGAHLSIWIAVPVDAKGKPITTKDQRRFEVYGTGHLVAVNRVHVGTVFDGPLVWHVFEDRSAG